MKKLIPLLVIVLFVFSFDSCKKEDKTDPDFCTTSWTVQLNDEINAVVNTLMAYSTDQTTANCNAYKEAMQDYIDALRQYDDCNLWTAEQKADFQDALDEAEQDLQTACQD